MTAALLPFDEVAADAYAEMRAAAEDIEKAIGTADGYIAATVKANGLALATRDSAGFWPPAFAPPEQRQHQSL